MERAEYVLLGWPVEHSLSPPMQQAAFTACGIDAGYEAIPVKPAALPGQVEQLRADPRVAGWNVTVPHKRAMVDLVDELGPDAAAARSVNTVVKKEGRLYGYSTDGYGLSRALEEAFSLSLQNCSLAFVGTGGAATATAVFLARQGVSGLTLLNRTPEKARSLAERIRCTAPTCSTQWAPLGDTDRLKGLLQAADVLIQSTSLGLKDDDPMPVSPELIDRQTCVYDMIYRETPFLAAVRAHGCPVQNGFGMLLYQGVRSFALWTGLEPPVEVMRQALLRAAT